MTSAERLERISLLKKQCEILKARIQSGNSHPSDLHQYYDLLKEIEKVQRIEAGFQDIMVFAKQYFTGEPPHDLLKADTPSPQFHYALAKYLREAVLDPMERKTAIAAPRSHAKSTIVTNIFPLWCIVYVEDVKERYWVILGDKQDNARKFLDVIKNELEDNDVLIADFGKLKGTTWNSLEIITKNNVKISAHGAQEGLRGLRYGSFRPSVICDDIESDDSCSTADRIAKMYDWFLRTCLPLGDPKHSKFFLVGTVIHYDSLLSRVINNHADWAAFKYRAIEEFPTQMDMWRKWELTYHERTEGDNPMESSRFARDKAMKFYEANKEKMHEGAKILWPERLDLLSLMEKRAVNRLAFNSEYQNDPIDEDSRIFHTIMTYDWSDVNIDDLEIYGAVDPSMGGKRSDPSVILTLGRHRKTGVMYVLDVDNKRRHPDQLIQDIFTKSKQFNYSALSVETVAFQQFMKDELVKRGAQMGIYLPVKEFKSTVKKEIRIEAIEPLMSNGLIRVLPTQRDLIEQLEYFPKAAHDDAIDALAQAVELAKKRTGAFSFGKI